MVWALSDGAQLPAICVGLWVCVLPEKRKSCHGQHVKMHKPTLSTRSGSNLTTAEIFAPQQRQQPREGKKKPKTQPLKKHLGSLNTTMHLLSFLASTYVNPLPKSLWL